MAAKRHVHEIAYIGERRKVIAERVKTDLQSEFLVENELLDADFVEPQILALSKNFLIREVGSGLVGSEAAARAIGHREPRNRIGPGAQLAQIEAQAEVDLLRIGGAPAANALRVRRRLADVMRDEVDAPLQQFLAYRQVAEQRVLDDVVERGRIGRVGYSGECRSVGDHSRRI